MTLTDDLDLGRLGLTAGEGRRLELGVRLREVALGGERYRPDPEIAAVTVDVSRMTSGGFALRLRLSASLAGRCMRCLEEARPVLALDAREVDQPGGGEELDSPYVRGQVLDLSGWAHDALVLALPAQILCRAECAGLCAVCGADLNRAGPEHAHERAPDPRWAKLGELELG